MAPKLLNTLSIVFLLVVFLLSVSSGIKGNNTGFELVPSPAANTTQFDSEFHLRTYGYYEYAQLNLETAASEDQILELAIKTYQGNFGIKPTGILDDQTLSSMMAPRCGNPDITGGVNSMNPHSRSIKGNSTDFELVKPPAANTTQFDSEFHLRTYGYYEYAQLNLGTGASEDQILELAIKTYQENFGIKPTGVSDDQTLSSMMAPRCGNPDIDIGVNSMNPRYRNLTAQL
ncbi:hypothetical protein SASPL_108167 [Salvia splendens]|uniref:Peptidoglycan binding-like domain-containing protein n=1 Tax=Salvia splendens TaxID=180675 RepID=A0A8X9A768_SALSN|nr:hypothetical protein SASPL_108167 [Salvia splendens]